MNAHIKASAILSAIPATAAVPAKLADDHVCTTSEAAALDFEPWQHSEGEWTPPSNEEWSRDTIHLVMIRVAWKLLYMTKSEMMKFIEDIPDDAGKGLLDQFSQTCDYFKGLSVLLSTAEARLLVAGSTVVEKSEKSKRKSSSTHKRTLDKAVQASVGAHRSAPSAVDPIFAALDEHRRLKKEWNSLSSQLDEAEGKVKAADPWPCPLIAWRNYSAIGHSEIERARDEFLEDRVASPKQIEREYKKAKERERAAQQGLRAWYKRNGLAKLKTETDRASTAEDKALMELTKIRPTTAAGAGALIAYVRLDMTTGDHPWQPKVLANASRALLNMPNEALAPFAPDAKDLDLSNAAYAMQNLDRAIDRLHKKHGDDADGRDDYRQLEDQRDEALDTLATGKARSSNGMIARAEVLTERRLIEDYQRHGLIAVALAKDVLRYFGA